MSTSWVLVGGLNEIISSWEHSKCLINILTTPTLLPYRIQQPPSLDSRGKVPRLCLKISSDENSPLGHRGPSHLDSSHGQNAILLIAWEIKTSLGVMPHCPLFVPAPHHK